jgi:hypothetical protein
MQVDVACASVARPVTRSPTRAMFCLLLGLARGACLRRDQRFTGAMGIC